MNLLQKMMAGFYFVHAHMRIAASLNKLNSADTHTDSFCGWLKKGEGGSFYIYLYADLIDLITCMLDLK